jgi:hypothetical protein
MGAKSVGPVLTVMPGSSIPSSRFPDHFREQLRKYLPGTDRIGVGQRRAVHRARTRMIEPQLVTHQRSLDLAQTRGAPRLAIEKGHELALRRQPAHPHIGPVLLHYSLEPMPRNMLQYSMKHAILVQHGVGPFRVQNVAQRSKHRRIHVMRRVHKI